ncbi:Hypothetical protein SMAX5B_006666 [Scophthalmus maximus]|uniref:Uncharacterized protein n=1 Tax=Scophthalmus maximus TaxID=52904 RepID=A0A2U9BKL1_SCOMX|nr:Hypothetical protein SMAX5B_006666 [Scophthalmus maximus]
MHRGEEGDRGAVRTRPAGISAASARPPVTPSLLLAGQQEGPWHTGKAFVPHPLSRKVAFTDGHKKQ